MKPDRLGLVSLAAALFLSCPGMQAQYQGQPGESPSKAAAGSAKAGGRGRNLPAATPQVYGSGRAGAYEDLPKAGFGQSYIKPRRLLIGKEKSDGSKTASDRAGADGETAADAPPPKKKKRLKTIYRDGVKRPAEHGSLLSLPTPEE